MMLHPIFAPVSKLSSHIVLVLLLEMPISETEAMVGWTKYAAPRGKVVCTYETQMRLEVLTSGLHLD